MADLRLRICRLSGSRVNRFEVVELVGVLLVAIGLGLIFAPLFLIVLGVALTVIGWVKS